MREQSNVLQAYLAGDDSTLEDIIEANQDFAMIAEHPVYVRLKAVVDGMYHSAAEASLDDPENAKLYKGIREGINIFHKLIGDQVQAYEAAQSALRDLVDRPDHRHEPTEPSSELVFGQSSL